MDEMCILQLVTQRLQPTASITATTATRIRNTRIRESGGCRVP